jgi:uncharacterized protein YqeY
MNLSERIDSDLTNSIKQKEETKKLVLRSVKSAIKNTEIDTGKSPLSDEEITNVIAKEVKKRKEAIEAFTQAAKPDLAADEKAELDILTVYLPEQMSEEEVRSIIKAHLTQNPATVSQMGQVMGALSSTLRGKADMGVVSKIVKEELGSA